MYTRSKSQSTETVKNKAVGTVEPLKRDLKRPPSTVSTKQGKPIDVYTDSTQEGTMAEAGNEHILSKLLEGQKQAKIAQQKNNEEIKKQFADMKTIMTKNSNKFDEYVKANDSVIAGVNKRVDTMSSQLSELDRQMKELQGKLKSFEDDMASTNERVDQAERDMNEASEEMQMKNKIIRKVEPKINAEEEEFKRCLVLIEGVPEKTKQKPREIAGNLLKELGISFVESDIRAAYRMGQIQNNQKRGRSIKVKFSASYFKQDRNISKLKGNQRWEGIIISDVLSQQEQEQRRDLRCIVAFAKSQGIEAKVKGDRLIIDEKVYKHEDLDELPHGLSMEKAKIIAVSDGWAFQSHHAYLSNMHPSKFDEGSKTYKTNEHYYQAQCAVFHKEFELEKRILKAKDGYEAKKLAKKIKLCEEWEKEKPIVMARGVALKFDQNPLLKLKLCRLNGKLYEATTDLFFTCGFTLAQHSKIKNGQNPGQNKLGSILEEYRENELKKVME